MYSSRMRTIHRIDRLGEGMSAEEVCLPGVCLPGGLLRGGGGGGVTAQVVCIFPPCEQNHRQV